MYEDRSSHAHDGIMAKIKKGQFYATQGPEIHIFKNDDGSVTVKTSPVCFISFYSACVWNKTRNHRGENLTEAIYIPGKVEGKWIRAEAVDKDGNTAWSNIILL